MLVANTVLTGNDGKEFSTETWRKKIDGYGKNARFFFTSQDLECFAAGKYSPEELIERARITV